MVSDWGGVFSPKMLVCCLLATGRMTGVRLGPGLASGSAGLSQVGVDGRFFSGDWERGVDEPENWPVSRRKPISLTEGGGWNDCRRLWAGLLAGDVSFLLLRLGVRASRAFSFRAA